MCDFAHGSNHAGGWALLYTAWCSYPLCVHIPPLIIRTAQVSRHTSMVSSLNTTESPQRLAMLRTPTRTLLLRGRHRKLSELLRHLGPFGGPFSALIALARMSFRPETCGSTASSARPIYHSTTARTTYGKPRPQEEVKGTSREETLGWVRCCWWFSLPLLRSQQD